MAIQGWSLINSDGGSQAGGVPSGIHQGVTFTAASAITIDASGKVELVFDNTAILSKTELLRCLERIYAAINNDQWPPTGQN